MSFSPSFALDSFGRFLQEAQIQENLFQGNESETLTNETISNNATQANATQGNATLTGDDGSSEMETSEVLRTTFRVYGIIFLIMFVIFCFVRKFFPRSYNVRNTYEHLRCELAANTYGFVSWMWGIFFIPHEEIFYQCGLDALAMIRILEFGVKLTLVGIFNSFFLIPVYKTAEISVETADITDKVQMVSLANVPPGSARMLGTVISAYILFGAAMYLIIQEFKWYTEHRHRYLTKAQPCNYAVYINGIPPEYQSNETLRKYFNDLLGQDLKVEKSRESMFRESFVEDIVLESFVALDIPNLDKLVNERDALEAKLKHANNIRDVKGIAPTHSTKLIGGVKVASIPTYTSELEQKNKEIEEAQRAVAQRQGDTHARIMQAMGTTSFNDSAAAEGFANEDQSGNNDIEAGEKFHGSSYQPVEQAEEPVGQQGSSQNFAMKSFSTLRDTASSVIGGGADGNPRIAGFVSFRTLRTSAAAVQMLHHEGTFEMSTEEAPHPDDILWENVGKSNKSIQLGSLISLCLTTVLCFFWTIPVSFVAAINDVESLVELLPFLEKWLEVAPWLSPVLAQLAPLLVVVLVSMLPAILLFFTKFEGHISDSTQQTSLFSKLAWFMIIQTFFISAISGSIFKELEGILKDPLSAVDLLARSLPAQSGYFMQISLVQTFMGVGLELLNVSPIAVAFVRSKIGPNLTEEERNSTWMGLRPLADVDSFDYAKTMSEFVLYFMIILVYSCISPIVPYVECLCLTLLLLGFRNNLVHFYPFKEDGGKVWTGFVGVFVWSMIIAEIVLIGVLLLKKSTYATPFVIPLIIITVLFKIYIGKQHYFVAAHLPGRICIEADRRAGKIDFSEFKGAYKQYALKPKEDTKDDDVKDELKKY